MSERRHAVGAAEEPLPSASTPARGVRTQARARRASPHAHKFLIITASLVGLAIGALIIAVFLASSSSPSHAAAWSSWSPQDNGLAGEREIAAAISPFYRATPAAQLAVVTVRNVSSTATGTPNTDLPTQVVLHDPSTGALVPLSGTTALYNLCGLGPGCTVSPGQPSSARELLLRREALELSLYTLKYISGVDNVLTLLPPGQAVVSAQLSPTPPAPTSTSTTTVDLAVLFERQGLSNELSAPLKASLPEQVAPSVADMTSAPEAELVSVLTGQGLFTQRTIQIQDGTQAVLLSQVPPQ
jgi:hypothetical protein